MDPPEYHRKRSNGYNRDSYSLTVVCDHENGDGAYRKPVALIENIVPPRLPNEPPPDYDQEPQPSGKHCFLCCACCGPNAHACGSHWRTGLRYSFYVIYVLCIFAAIPVIIVVYRREATNERTRTWLIGGIFVFLSLPISLQLILMHLIHYTKPKLQLFIVRILWMPPIYAMDSWLSLRFPDYSIYPDTLRELYEAYVIYNFMQYLMHYLLGEFDLVAKLDAKPKSQEHPRPFKWILPKWTPAKRFIFNCKLGVLQYTVIRIATTLVAFITELCGVYGEGNWNFKSSYAYLAIVNNVSQSWALYCLVLFYEGMKEELKPIGALSKFLCVKLVVFATFWQAIVITIVLHFTGTGDQHLVPHRANEDEDKKYFSTALQDLLVCIEMIFAAFAHHYAFSYKPFKDKGAPQIPFCQSFFHTLDVRDVAKDVAKHAKEIAGKEGEGDADGLNGQDNQGASTNDDHPELKSETLSAHR